MSGAGGAGPARAPAATSREPVSILIAALGGQGGGVLTDWIVGAARRDGFVAQATSSPGVSQRSGATTYYVEIAPAAGPGAPVRTPELSIITTLFEPMPATYPRVPSARNTTALGSPMDLSRSDWLTFPDR